MKLTTTATHKITFEVVYHEATEGGMDSGDFGKPVETLPEAIHNLELARKFSPEIDWTIECDVQTIVDGK